VAKLVIGGVWPTAVRATMQDSGDGATLNVSSWFSVGAATVLAAFPQTSF